jgi:hypothetical protein
VNKKFLLSIAIAGLLASCARVESPQITVAIPDEVAEQFNLADYSGAKQSVMVYPWNISKIDLEKYPILRDHRIGFGVTNRLADILFDVERFSFVEEKQEIAERLVQQMQLCKTADVCKNGGIKKLELQTADYIIYPEVYHFGVEKNTDITGIDTTNRQYVEIGIQIKIVNAHTAATEAVGNYIGRKVLTSQGDIFNNPQIDFSQSALGKATDSAIKGAIAKTLKRFDKIVVSNPSTKSTEPTVIASYKNKSKLQTETEGRSGDDSHKSISVNTKSNSPISIPVNSSQKRLALVIGNSDYQKAGASLANAGHDAEDISNELKKLGFDVTLSTNQTKQGMEQTIQAFGQKLKNAGKDSTALFYYAGHAAEVEGVNYMFPVDVQLDGEKTADKEAVPVKVIVDQMSGNDLKILVLDACRDNPYPVQKRSFNSQHNRLSTMSAPKGTIISYSTASGKQASDGAGRNGLYTGVLLQNIEIPAKIEEVFKRVRIAVSQQSRNNQIAWENSSLVGDFYFVSP